MLNKKIAILCMITINYFTLISDVISISVPKTGTHLLSECIAGILGKTPNFSNIVDSRRDDKSTSNVYWNHLRFTQQYAQKLKRDKKFLLIRDPRDQVVSMTFWAEEEIKNKKERFLKIYLKQLKGTDYMAYHHLTFKERLNKLIFEGSPIYDGFNPFLKTKTYGISNFYHAYLPWLKEPNVCLIRFENLVGAKGGGSDELQYKEIQKIAKHLGVKLSDERIKQITSGLFGGTRTFRSGQIGGWKKCFSPEIKTNFKRVAAKLLIELGYEKDLNW